MYKICMYRAKCVSKRLQVLIVQFTSPKMLCEVLKTSDFGHVALAVSFVTQLLALYSLAET
jgi:hypothetical protein